MATGQKCFQRIQALRQVFPMTDLAECSALCQFGADICLYGFSTFLPIIIEAMGYSAVEAQYLTIPGNVSHLQF